MGKAIFWTALVLALTASPAAAQVVITGYRLNVYPAGSTSLRSSTDILSTVASCDLAVTNITPTPPMRVIQWDDQLKPGRMCMWTDTGSGPTTALPVGAYEAALQAFNTTDVSPESNRAPFAVAAPTVEQPTIEQLQAQIVALKDQLSTVQGQVTLLQTQVTTLTAERNTARTERDTAMAATTTALARIDTIKALIQQAINNFKSNTALAIRTPLKTAMTK